MGRKKIFTENTKSAIQDMQKSLTQSLELLEIPVDNMELENTTDKTVEEKKVEIAEEIKEKINETLKKLKEESKEGLNDFVFQEKVELLEKTKKAVESNLLQIISSPNGMSPKSVEVLALIIKVNADLIKDISIDPVNNNGININTQNNDSGNSQIFIAPSQDMLKALLKERHKN